MVTLNLIKVKKNNFLVKDLLNIKKMYELIQNNGRKIY